jgi:hypothetical protein
MGILLFCVFHYCFERKIDQFVSLCYKLNQISIKFSAKKLHNKFSSAAIRSLNMTVTKKFKKSQTSIFCISHCKNVIHQDSFASSVFDSCLLMRCGIECCSLFAFSCRATGFAVRLGAQVSSRSLDSFCVLALF